MSASIIDTLEYAMHVVVFISLVMVFLFSLKHFSHDRNGFCSTGDNDVVDTQFVCK